MALLMKYKLYLIVALMMIFEAVTLVFVLPKGSASVEAEEVAKAKAATSKDSDFVEIELAAGKINNTSDPGVPVAIDYKVYGVVSKDSESDFKAEFDKKKFRVKEAVVTVLRKASYDALQEPSLTTIKRQIKEAVSEVVGKERDFLNRVVVPEFRTTDL